MCVNSACTQSSDSVSQVEGLILGPTPISQSKHSPEVSTSVRASQLDIPHVQWGAQHKAACCSAPALVQLPQCCLGQVCCGTWAWCATERGDFTGRAQPADIYRRRGCRGRFMRAVQRPHYFRSKVFVAQNPLSSHAQEQMLKSGGQARLKLPAARSPSTWPESGLSSKKDVKLLTSHWFQQFQAGFASFEFSRESETSIERKNCGYRLCFWKILHCCLWKNKIHLPSPPYSDYKLPFFSSCNIWKYLQLEFIE